MSRTQQELKNFLHKKRQDSWISYLKSLTPEDVSIWGAARKIKSSVSYMPPINIPNPNICAYIDEEKANTIASSLELQFTGNTIIDYEIEREINDIVRNFLSIPPLPILFQTLILIEV